MKSRYGDDTLARVRRFALLSTVWCVLQHNTAVCSDIWCQTHRQSQCTLTKMDMTPSFSAVVSTTTHWTFHRSTNTRERHTVQMNVKLVCCRTILWAYKSNHGGKVGKGTTRGMNVDSFLFRPPSPPCCRNLSLPLLHSLISISLSFCMHSTPY